MNTTIQQLKWFKWAQIRPFLVITLLALFFTLLLPSSIFAASNRYLSPTGVDTNNDCADSTNPCATFSHAISQANDGDTIQLAPGIYTEANIVISKNLTISGQNQDNTIVQAFEDPIGNWGNVFTLEAPSASLVNLTIQHSNSDEGAAIYAPPPSDGGTKSLAVSAVTVRDNIGYGIVMDWTTGGVNIDNSHIYNNTGFGAIAFNLHITNSIIENNVAGGVATFIGGSATIANSQINRNGCGICGSDYSDMTITNSLISENTYEGIHGRSVTILDSTISRNGSDGIWVEASVVVLQDSVIAYNGGSGFEASDSYYIVIDNTTIAGNGDSGIYLDDSPVVRIGNSTINNNHSTVCGGGIYSYGSSVELRNVTITGNKANTHGGGLCFIPYFENDTAVLNNVTFTLNVADHNQDGDGDGGGIYTVGGSSLIYVQNTILAGNKDSSFRTQHPDCSGTFNSQDYNLIQNATGCTIVGETSHNLVGLSPLLQRLADNGGPSKTHALSFSSPAVNAGNPAVPGSGGSACELTDQRGELRDAFCDIGSFEVK
jgi:hypothetical protein